MNKLLTFFTPKLTLNEEEAKIEQIIIKLLEKQDTDIQEDYESMSYMLSNARLDSYVEVNGSVSVSSNNTAIKAQMRLTVVEHFKKLIQKEASARYKAAKKITFDKTLSLLDSMEQNLLNN